MMTPEQIAALREILKEVGERVSDHMFERVLVSLVSLEGIETAAELRQAIARELALLGIDTEKETAKAQRIIKRLTRAVGETAAKQTAERAGGDYKEECGEIIAEAIETAAKSLGDIIQNSGFEVDRLPWTMEEAYTRAAEQAFRESMEGEKPWRDAFQDATKELCNRGIRSLPRAKEQGHKAAAERMRQTAAEAETPGGISIEAAMRETLLSTLGTMQDDIEHRMAEVLGTDGWEITAHACSAPDHEPIQGRQYSNAEYETLNDSLVRRIGTLNCGHAAFPVMLGQGPQYTDEELERFRKDNETGKTIDGKHYTGYELTQKQREYERSIRAAHRRFLAGVHGGNQTAADRWQTRYNQLKAEYKAFSRKAGLRLQPERLWIPEQELGQL